MTRTANIFAAVVAGTGTAVVAVAAAVCAEDCAEDGSVALEGIG